MGYGLKDPERGCFAEVGKVVAIEILWSKPEARDADRRGFWKLSRMRLQRTSRFLPLSQRPALIRRCSSSSPWAHSRPYPPPAPLFPCRTLEYLCSSQRFLPHSHCPSSYWADPRSIPHIDSSKSCRRVKPCRQGEIQPGGRAERYRGNGHRKRRSHSADNDVDAQIGKRIFGMSGRHTSEHCSLVSSGIVAGGLQQGWDRCLRLMTPFAVRHQI